jgi:hypothetical protein
MNFTKRASERLVELLQEYDEPGILPCAGAVKSESGEPDFTLDFIFPENGVSYVNLELTKGCKVLCREVEAGFLQDITFDYQPGGLNAGWRALSAEGAEKD